VDRHSVKIMFNGEAYRAECVCGYRSDDFGRESDAKKHGDDHVLPVGGDRPRLARLFLRSAVEDGAGCAGKEPTTRVRAGSLLPSSG
jgi:hypothetical protein